MVKILSARQIKELDAYTIKHEPIASIDLMERACEAFVTWFTEKFDASHKVGIVCGTGNNGGDGLGIARMLTERSYPLKVWVIKGTVPQSADFKENLKRIENAGVAITEIVGESESGLFQNCNILIDAIFGSGLSRPVEGLYGEVIHRMNQAPAIRVAVDIPSGLMADQHSEGAIIKADYTVSFQLPKLAFLMGENNDFTGEWITVNIGLSKEFIQQSDSQNFLVEQRDVRKIRKKRNRFSHKGNYGRALIISGSYGKMGAAVLASRAAMRSGLGLLTVHIPKCGYSILQTAVPEAMLTVDTDEHFFSSSPEQGNYNAIGIGPGLGTEKKTVYAFSGLLQSLIRPIVVDADGLNILAANRELLHLLPEGSILTPHPKEFERLTNESGNDFESLEIQRDFSIKTRTYLLLKGAYTSISTPDGKVFFNPTGNPGMATGGSGDVLTGLLTGLLAQGYTPLETTLFGAYLHGMAGDIAAKEKGVEGIIASDIIESLPPAFLRLS